MSNLSNHLVQSAHTSCPLYSYLFNPTATPQAKYDEQQRLASLVKEKEQESKYSKVRMSDAQREYVQDIIRTAQAATPAASASSVSMSAFGGGDDDDDDFGGDALPDDDDEDGNGFSDADDDECTSSSAAVCVAESAEVRALTAELLRLGFSSADIRPAIAFADESDWRSVEAERQKQVHGCILLPRRVCPYQIALFCLPWTNRNCLALGVLSDLNVFVFCVFLSHIAQLAVDREKAHAAALSAKSKKGGLKGFPARPQSAAASVSSSSSASASAATPAMSDLPGALLDNALEWLCIHLPEERLPAQFDPRRKQAKIVKLGQSTPSATSASTPAAATSTPAASAADASALLSRSIDDVWQALPSLGLSATACEAVCARVQSAFDAQCAQANTPGSASGRKAKPVSRTAVQTRALLFIFRRLYAHWNADAVPDSVRVEAGLALSGAADSDSEDGAIRVSVARTEAECQLSLETVTDELDVLSSIFGESECEREPSFSLWRIKLGGSGSGASNASTKRADAWVEFLVCDGAVYPNELPIIVIRHATLTAAQRLSCLQHLVEGFDASALGAPLSYQLFTQLQGSLFQYASMTSDISLPATLGGAPPTPAHEPGSGLPNDSTAASAAPATRKTARPASAAPSSSAVAQSKEPGASASAATAAASAASSLSATAKSHERSHRTARPLRDDRALNAQLAAELAAKDKLPAYRNMQMLRQRLPAAAARAEIIRLLDARQVIVISGETGCGKSTQVPQFVLDACLAGGRGSTTSIVCTQPRRISAIGLAERVASERAEECGRSVGYSVRMQVCAEEEGDVVHAVRGVVLCV